MEPEGGAAARWDASPDGVIVLPAGSAAPWQALHGRQQREREWEQEQQRPAAGVLVEQDQRLAERVFYKTKLCEKFEAGWCAYEDGCTFAHGHAELRPPLPVPPGSVVRRRPPLPPPPPAAAEHDHARGPSGGGYYGKVCFEFRDKGTCHFGDRCTYAHASAAAAPEMRYPGGARLADPARRSATPPARAFSPVPAAGAPRGGVYYAPTASRAFLQPAAAAGEGDDKVSRLELLSRRKLSGIYGDWPEED